MFNSFFLKPIYNIVVFFLDVIPGHDIGIAIILTTILVKLILLKPNINSQKSNYLMREAQAEIDGLKNKYKSDNKKIAEETMLLYKEKKIKPFSSILVLIIQIPVFFALYYVFRDGVSLKTNLLYSFNHFPEYVKSLAFGFLDLSKKHWLVGVFTAITMFIFSKRQADTFKKISGKSKPANPNSFQASFAKNLQTQMVYFLPIISGISAAVLPSVIGVYWIANNILNILQDIYIQKKLNMAGFIKKHKN